jgi:hypothetical protein
MTAMGQTSGDQCARIRSALPQSSDVSGARQHFAFVPTAVVRDATDMFRSSVYTSFPNRMDNDRCARPDLSVVWVR